MWDVEYRLEVTGHPVCGVWYRDKTRFGRLAVILGVQCSRTVAGSCCSEAVVKQQ